MISFGGSQDLLPRGLHGGHGVGPSVTDNYNYSRALLHCIGPMQGQPDLEHEGSRLPHVKLFSGLATTQLSWPARQRQTRQTYRHAVVLYAMRLNFGKSHCTILVGHMMTKNSVTINCMLLVEYYMMLFCITEMQGIAQYLLKQLASCLHYANDSNDIAITSSRNATVNIDGCLPSNRISRI